jgi:chemotaxis signal transduction protein
MTGVVDVRGEVIPVFDLRARFGLKARDPEAEPLARQMFLRVDGRTYGLVVDHVQCHSGSC